MKLSRNYNVNSNMLLKYKDANVVILFDYFINQYQFIDNDIWIDNKRFIHISYEEIQNDLPYSNSLIRKYIKLLELDGYVEVKRLGIPAKNYYWFPYCNNDKIDAKYLRGK